MNKFDKLFNTIMEDVKSSKKAIIKEDIDLKEQLKEMINEPAVSNPSKKCNDLIDSLTDEELNKFTAYLKELGMELDEEGMLEGWGDWYDLKDKVNDILDKYSSWCQKWEKDNKENEDYYSKWKDGELEDDEDQPEEMDYGWVTDDRILRGAYPFYYEIGDALNEGIIKDKFDALILYGYLQMYWNSIDEPDYDDGIAACGVDLD